MAVLPKLLIEKPSNAKRGSLGLMDAFIAPAL